jgi:hypothetical protein
MRLRYLLIGLLLASPANAAPILYDFTATVTVTKFNFDRPITLAEEAYWFPDLNNGATYDATGRFSYDVSNPQASVTLGRYTWEISNNLGIVSTSSSLHFIDSFPTITSGLACVSFTSSICFMSNGDDFFGRDGSATMTLSNGVVTGGDFTMFGTGDTLALDPNRLQLQTTAISWTGLVDSVTRVPEPATLLLAAVGVLFVRRCRRVR